MYSYLMNLVIWRNGTYASRCTSLTSIKKNLLDVIMRVLLDIKGVDRSVRRLKESNMFRPIKTDSLWG